ncbi:lem3 cdc50 family protein [Xylariaceae sp. FL0016]|nr:lem3 cdc50 family protein [Xylariaceae sp. FL0016]
MDENSPPESIDQSKEKKKSRRPANTAFRQQRLKAWQPILTPKTVIPLFFVIGLITAPIGGLLLYASSTVKEIRIDYTNCFKDAPTDTQAKMGSDLVFPSFQNDNNVTALWQRFEGINQTYNGNPYVVENLTQCRLQFNIPEDMSAPVLMYYRLENFYQNHRRYVASYYDEQLLGNDVSLAQVDSSECDPLASLNGKAIYPCGLIANSLFNDTISSPRALGTTDESTYQMNSTGIAWSSDKALYGERKSTDYSGIVPPPDWQKQFPNGSYTADNPPPNLKENEHFIVWMRTAGLPTFSKLYARNNNDKLVAGNYEINITDTFRTDVYQGKKSIVLTTLSVMGGKNQFLGILWLVVGGFCLALALVFLATNLVKPRKLGDHTYLSWNNAPPSTAAKGKGKASGPSTGMTTGRDMS